MPLSNPARRRTGSVFYVTSDNAPEGAVEASGQTLSRVTDARLWAYAQASGNLAASEGAKQKGQYGPGDGATTFTVPNLQGEFIRSLDKAGSVDPARTVGSSQDHAYQAHTHHSAGGFSMLLSSSTGGAIEAGAGSAGRQVQTMGTGSGNAGGENRPRNVALLACIER